MNRKERQMRREFRAFADSAYRKIKDVVPHIHRVEMYLRKGAIEELSRVLRAYTPKSYQTADPTYRKVKFFELKGVKFSLHYWSDPNRPDFRIKAASPTPESLIELNRRVPDLVIRYVEYAVDFMCEEPEDVPYVHWLLRKYLWFPGYTGPVDAAGSPFKGVDDDRIENSVSYFWNNGKEPNAVKIYERGPDKLKKIKEDGKPWWHMKDVDRVRLEFVFTKNKGKYHLKNQGIRLLEKFMMSPNMAAMLKDKFESCVFEGTTALPAEWEVYEQMDDSGGIESFHLERLYAENQGISTVDYRVNAKHMVPLMITVRKALEAYDKMWRKAALSELKRRVKIILDKGGKKRLAGKKVA